MSKYLFVVSNWMSSCTQVLSMWGPLPVALLVLRMHSALELLLMMVHKILTWVMLRWCLVGSTSLAVPCTWHLWEEQSHTQVSRPSLAQAVTGEGEVRNGCCFVDGSNSRVYGSKIHPCRGEGISILVMSRHNSFGSQKPWDNQGTCGTRHESWLQADLWLLDVGALRSCHKVAAMAALAYLFGNRNRCPDQY